MTDAKLVKIADISGGGDASSRLAEYMRAGADLHGLISDDLVKPEDGVVESSYSGDFMERVALAIDLEVDKASRKEPPGEPNIRAALKKAGCSEHQYLQLGQHPDYLEINQRIYRVFILLPRYPMICRAITKSAMHGDVTAAKWVSAQIEKGDMAMEDAIKSLEREGAGAVQRVAADIQKELHGLIANTEVVAPPDGILDGALEDVHSRDKLDERHNTIDHKGLYSKGVD